MSKDYPKPVENGELLFNMLDTVSKYNALSGKAHGDLIDTCNICGISPFDLKTAIKELIAQEKAKWVEQAAIMGAKFGNAAFRQQSIAEPGKAINLDKVRDSGIKQAVAWARENL